jgi:hypothetical protein
MRFHAPQLRTRTSAAFAATLGLALLLLLGVLAGCGAEANAAPQPTTPPERPDQEVVTTYFQILNAGMTSGDFSALATVYAPDATLTQSAPNGTQVVATGLKDITGWYVGFQSAHPGIQFAQDKMRSLAPHVVLSYEHAPASWAVPGRCMHLFTLKGGMIETLDWATYFGGVKPAAQTVRRPCTGSVADTPRSHIHRAPACHRGGWGSSC